jgi:hypothetical protein
LFYKDPQGNSDALKDGLGNKLAVIVDGDGESSFMVLASMTSKNDGCQVRQLPSRA